MRGIRAAHKWLSPQALAAVANVAFIGLGTFADVLRPALRVGIVIPALLIAGLAFMWAQRRQQGAEAQREELFQLKEQQLESFRAATDALDVEDAIDSLAQRVVPEGAWRLSLYEFDGASAWRRLARRASDPYFESGGRETIDRESSILKMVSGFALRGSQPVVQLTGEFPDRERDPEGWLAAQESWQLPRHVAEQVRFPARRLAVSSTRLDGVRGALVAVVIEVTDPQTLEELGVREHVSRDVLTMLVKLCNATELMSKTKVLLHG